MKYPIVFVLAFIGLLPSCKEQKVEEIEIIKDDANAEKEEIPERLLMHDVYLNLKDSVTEKEIEFALNQLKRLDDLKTTLWVHAGKRAETGDSRLNKEYDLALHVVFTSEENLHEYDNDSTHADVRAKLKDLLVGPPEVYDYWSE